MQLAQPPAPGWSFGQATSHATANPPALFCTGLGHGRTTLFLGLPVQQGPQDVGKVVPQANLSRVLQGHRGLFQDRDGRAGRAPARVHPQVQ